MVRKTLILLVAITLFTLIFGHLSLEGVTTPALFQIRITSDKVSYFVREPISVCYEVQNISDSTLCIAFDEVNESFNIKDQLGRGYSNILLSDYIICPDTIKPNQIFTGCVNITARYRVINTGKYTCFVNFYGDTSNVLKIEVIEPKGDEKKALDIYLEAEDLRWARSEDGGPDWNKLKLSFTKYLELAEKYPNSVYASLALVSARGIYRYSPDLQERKKIIPVCKRLIVEYPNSPYFMSAFNSLVEVYEIFNDKDGAVKTMKELMEGYPDTKISEEAKRRLKHIEKWEF